jgi:hypothetical protein
MKTTDLPQVVHRQDCVYPPTVRDGIEVVVLALAPWSGPPGPLGSSLAGRRSEQRMTGRNQARRPWIGDRPAITLRRPDGGVRDSWPADVRDQHSPLTWKTSTERDGANRFARPRRQIQVGDMAGSRRLITENRRYNLRWKKEPRRNEIAELLATPVWVWLVRKPVQGVIIFENQPVRELVHGREVRTSTEGGGDDQNDVLVDEGETVTPAFCAASIGQAGHLADGQTEVPFEGRCRVGDERVRDVA